MGDNSVKVQLNANKTDSLLWLIPVLGFNGEISL